MRLKGVLIALAALLLFGSANPDPFPDDYFASPLKIPLLLAGSFAEMRSNHFHSGLDIKTQGRTGYRVYAAADGWISRIAVSPNGYGNALYVSHPNGYMTVYAHLDKFSAEIQRYVKELQYKNESFAVQNFPDRDQFPVVQGQQIALSGNSGGSAGPHLHFEIRDERTGYPVNPMLWGMDIVDHTPPRIFRFKVYPIGVGSSVRLQDSRTGGWRTVTEGENAFVELTRSNGKIVMQRVSRIEASGKIGFGVQTHDYHEGSNNRLGAFRITLRNGFSTLFRSEMTQFAFDQTRYINAHVDYAERRTSGRWIQLSHVLPGNQLPVYETTNSGILDVVDGRKYDLAYDVADAVGNSSHFDFEIYGLTPVSPATTNGHQENSTMFHDRPFSLRRGDFVMRAPAGAIYQDDVLTYETVDKKVEGALYSMIHHLHDPFVPVHKGMTMEITPSGLPVELREKALIAFVAENGSLSSAGGEWKDGSVSTSVRSFGDFAVTVDTDPPSIRGLNISAGKNMSASGEIRLRIRDSFSGIKSYRVLIDGKWALFEYDSKYSLLRHRFESTLQKGNHTLDAVVTDNKNNEAHLNIGFRR